MKCRKCGSGDVKKIKGYISNMSTKNDVVLRCLSCGYLENLVLDCGAWFRR